MLLNVFNTVNTDCYDIAGWLQMLRPLHKLVEWAVNRLQTRTQVNQMAEIQEPTLSSRSDGTRVSFIAGCYLKLSVPCSEWSEFTLKVAACYEHISVDGSQERQPLPAASWMRCAPGKHMQGCHLRWASCPRKPGVKHRRRPNWYQDSVPVLRTPAHHTKLLLVACAACSVPK